MKYSRKFSTSRIAMCTNELWGFPTSSSKLFPSLHHPLLSEKHKVLGPHCNVSTSYFLLYYMFLLKIANVMRKETFEQSNSTGVLISP